MENIPSYDNFNSSIEFLTQNLGVIGTFLAIIAFVIFVLLISMFVSFRQNGKQIADYQKKLDKVLHLNNTLGEIQKSLDIIDRRIGRMEIQISNEYEKVNNTMNSYLQDIVDKKTKLEQTLNNLDVEMRTTIANLMEINQEMDRQNDDKQVEIQSKYESSIISFIGVILEFQQFLKYIKNNEELMKIMEGRVTTIRSKIKRAINSVGVGEFRAILESKQSKEVVELIEKEIGLPKLEDEQQSRIFFGDDLL